MPVIAPWDFAFPPILDRFTSYWYATLCRVCYTGVALDQLFVAGLANLTTRVNVNVQAYATPEANIFLQADNSAVLIINGTTQWQQYLEASAGTEFMSPSPYGGNVNSFFAQCWRLLGFGVKPRLLTLLPPRLAICGHSLGGAIATLATRELEVIYPVFRVWSIASPRVGDATFAAGWTRAYARIQNQGDIVPLLPPNVNVLLNNTFFPRYSQVPTAYRHVVDRFLMEEDGSASVSADFSSWREGSNAGLIGAAATTATEAAHDTPEYARRLRIGIPVPFDTAAPAWPGLQALDHLNLRLNRFVPWNFHAPTVVDSPQPPIADLQIERQLRSIPPLWPAALDSRKFAVEGTCP
jgi:Lipase (class 3)